MVGVAVWSVLVVALAAWELFALFHGPRHVYPTASSLLHEVDRSHPIRAVLFLAWLAFGWDLLKR